MIENTVLASTVEIIPVKGWRGILQKAGMWGEFAATCPGGVQFLDKLSAVFDIEDEKNLLIALRVYLKLLQ